MTEANYTEPDKEAISSATEKVSTKLNSGRQSEVCLNCGERTPRKFCQECGQANDNFHVSAWKIVSDFVSEYFTLDRKFFGSILPLIFRPGYLTREFCAGRRLRYISPLRLFLFISLVYFFLVPFYKGQLLNLDPNNPSKVELPALSSQPPKEPLSLKAEDKSPDNQLKDRINKKVEKIASTNGKEVPKILTDAFLGQISKVVFVLLPIFALFLKLLYLRSKRYYAEHLIFALHYFSFVFLLLIAAALSGKADMYHSFAFLLLLKNIFSGKWELFSWTPLVFGIYLYWSMKTVYGGSWLKTGVKFLILVFVFMTCLTLSSAAILALSS